MPIVWTTAIRTSGSDLKAHVSAPVEPASAGVVLLTAVNGPDEATVALADQLAYAGIAVVTPDLFHRVDPLLQDPYERIARLTWDGSRADVATSVAYLRRALGVTGRVAVLGFCMGGAIALLAAAESDVDVAVLYYPHDLYAPFGPDGPVPLERAGTVRIPVLGHFGADDPGPSPVDAKRLDDALVTAEHYFYSYPGCGHGFAGVNPKRRNAVATTVAFARTYAWLHRYGMPEVRSTDDERKRSMR